MPKSNDAEEVQVLRFFEEEPIEKAELLFNIVQNKMQTRLAENNGPRGEEASSEKSKRQKRRAAENRLPEEVRNAGSDTQMN